MRRIAVALSTIILGLGMAIVPSPASAAAGEFGNPCSANALSANTTFVMTAGSVANPLPVAASSTGVMTKARFTVPTVPSTFPAAVKILRATGVPNQYTTVASTGVLSIPGGGQTFDVRLPVTAGDLLGLGGASPLLCSTGNPGDVLGSVPGDSAPGSTATYTLGTSAALPLVGTVEPDVDKDGFGDVTQDLCPQSASFQGACPVIVLDSFAASAGTSITVVVATTSNANVKVTGKAKVNGKTIKLKGGSKLVTPEALTKFKVKLPQSLRSALAALPPSKRIKVTLSATSTDLIGRVSTDKSNVKLPGTR